MNFAFSPHSWDLVDNCHYTAIFSEVTLTLLVCDSVVNPSRICALIKKKKRILTHILDVATNQFYFVINQCVKKYL